MNEKNKLLFTGNLLSKIRKSGTDLIQVSDGETTYLSLLGYTFAHLLCMITISRWMVAVPKLWKLLGSLHLNILAVRNLWIETLIVNKGHTARRSKEQIQIEKVKMFTYFFRGKSFTFLWFAKCSPFNSSFIWYLTFCFRRRHVSDHYFYTLYTSFNYLL